MDDHRSHTSKRPRILVLCTLLAIVVSHDLAVAPRASSSTADLQLERLIRTTPFEGSNVSMKDSEGSALVPRDKSLWLADDNGRAVYEVNPATGRLKRQIGPKRFESARRLGGGPLAGADRTRDLESMAYDRSRDALYVFSGPCCSSSVRPTVFRLKRNSKGALQVESYQPLPKANFTAAGWNAANRRIYVGHGATLRTYQYATNTVGRAFRVPDLTGITGMGFSADGADLFVTTSGEMLRRVRWATKRLVAGWTFDLARFGIGDSRAVEVIGRRFYVLDGDDARPRSDPLRYAVYVFGVS